MRWSMSRASETAKDGPKIWSTAKWENRPIQRALTDTGLLGRNKSVVGKEGKNMAHKFSFGTAYQAMIHKLCV